MSQVIHSTAGACRDCGEAVGNVHRWSCIGYRVGNVAGRLVEAVECGPLQANAIQPVAQLVEPGVPVDSVKPMRTMSDLAADVMERAFANPNCPGCGLPWGELHHKDCPVAQASDHAALREQARLAAKHRLADYIRPFDGVALTSAAHPQLNPDSLEEIEIEVPEPVRACVACKWSKVMAGSKGLLCHYNPPGPAGFPPVLATDWCREFRV